MGVSLQLNADLYQGRSLPVGDKSLVEPQNGTARYKAIAYHRRDGGNLLGHTERSTIWIIACQDAGTQASYAGGDRTGKQACPYLSER
jgi:hypothetical protein